MLRSAPGAKRRLGRRSRMAFSAVRASSLAGAEMSAEAEGEVVLRAAVQVEARGVRKLVLVAVGGSEREQNLCAGRQLDTGECGRSSRFA